MNAPKDISFTVIGRVSSFTISIFSLATARTSAISTAFVPVPTVRSRSYALMGKAAPGSAVISE